ncbi:hypothetical protein, partial [Sediminimonas qiaohouensis]|uniref:hypothetical protein n=1 Tax=Sediminimonas qiaohouensis TaxID=552061 RepID=UPI00056A8FD0
MMWNKTMQKLATLACVFLPATAASAETSYPDFAEMDMDARILVIREGMHFRLQEAEQDAPVKAACIAELFSPQGDGQLSLGYRTTLLHKLVEGQTPPFPRQTHPTGSVMGMPSAV